MMRISRKTQHTDLIDPRIPIIEADPYHDLPAYAEGILGRLTEALRYETDSIDIEIIQSCWMILDRVSDLQSLHGADKWRDFIKGKLNQYIGKY